MDMRKINEKLKEGVSVRDVEAFVRHHTMEFFSILAIIIATITSAWDYFTGPKLAIFFLSLSTIISIITPAPIERWLKQFYNFTLKQEKAMQFVFGFVKVGVAIFIPFILFAIVGLLAGTSYHYFMRHAQVMKENKPTKPE